MMEISKEHFDFCINLVLKKLEEMEEKFLKAPDKKSILGPGDTLLDNTDMCELLDITKRTLQRYRQKKLLTYYMIDGKCYYKKSEVLSFFQQFKKKEKVKKFDQEP